MYVANNLSGQLLLDFCSCSVHIKVSLISTQAYQSNGLFSLILITYHNFYINESLLIILPLAKLYSFSSKLTNLFLVHGMELLTKGDLAGGS